MNLSDFYKVSGLHTVTIPGSVTTIGGSAFSECPDLEEVTILDGVETIGGSAFRTCRKLKKVTMGKDVKTIESYAFYDDALLEELTLPPSMEWIKYYSFSGCTGLKTLSLPAGVNVEQYAFRSDQIETLICPDAPLGDSFSDDAFFGMPKLTSITLPGGMGKIPAGLCYSVPLLETIIIGEGITEIGKQAFWSCGSLKTLVIPSTVKKIGNEAFLGAENLTSVEFKEGLEEIGASAFYESGLVEVSLPSTLKSIGSATLTGGYFHYGAFQKSALTKVTFQEGLTAIYDCSFEECKKLTEVTLPSSLEHLGNDAFRNCTSLSSINLPSKLKNVGEQGFAGCTALKTISLPANCTFKTGAFNGAGLTSVVWPETPCYFTGNGHFAGTQFENIVLPQWLETVNNSMFNQCYSLASIKLPEQLKVIDDYAFHNCTKLMNVKFPASMEKIGVQSFYNCPLGELTLPADATIGQNAFAYTSLTTLTFPKKPCFFTDRTFTHQQTLETLTLPAWMERVPDYFMDYCESLQTINFTLPDPLPQDGKYIKEIGYAAFSYCKRLHDIAFPTTIEVIDEYAFEYCGTEENYEFGTLTLNDGVELKNYCFQGCKIQKLLFNGCSEFKTGVLRSVTTISEIAFPECMEEIPAGFCSGWTALEKVTFPPTVKKIGASAFYGCSSIKNIELPDGLIEIGSEAFISNSKLESVRFPDNDVKIGYRCFEGNGNLNTVEFSWKQSSIGQRAFYGDLKLENIVWRKAPEGESAADLTIGDEAFCSNNLKTITFPDANINIGYSAYRYSTVTSIEWPGEDKKVTIGPSAFYDCTGLTTLTTHPLTTEIGGSAFRGCSNLTDVVITSPGPTKIEETAFYRVPIKNLTLNEGLKTIGANGFGTTDIESIHLPSTLTEFTSAFVNCKSLTNLTFAENFEGTTISKSAFQECSALTNFTFPESITSISANAFEECTSLTELNFPPKLTSIGYQAFRGCSGLSHLVIPEHIKVIYEYGFSECTGLLDVINNANKLNISDGSAFYGCSSMETFTTNGVLTQIGNATFANCSSLKHFINNSGRDVTDVRASAFNGCSALEEADFFKKVKSCDHSIFANCTSLRQFTMSDSIYITPKSILYGCDHLESIVWPDNPEHKFGMKADQIAEAPLRALSYSYVTDIVAPTSVSDKSSMDAYVGKGGSSYYLTNPKISKLMVPRGEKWKYHEKGYGELFDIVEMADPKVELTGDIFSNYDEEKNVNNYIAYLRWHLPLSDLNPNDSTKVEVFRDGKRIAEILFSKPSEPHHDPRWECDSVVTVQVTYNGSQLKAFRGQFIGLDETGEYWRKEYCLQDSIELVFDAKTSKRQLAFDRYSYKSWFAFADYFDSPKLTEKNVPTSYTYSVKMRGFRYMTLENNPGLEEKDGKLYKEVWHEPKEFDCPKVKLYTVNAFPTLQFNGLYSESDVMEDIARIKDVSSTDNMKGGYRISYMLDTESLMQKGYDAEKENDKEYFIKSVELRQYKDGKYVPVAEYTLPSGKDDGAKRQLTGEFDIANGFTVEPGNTYITITHSTGFRNDFGSGPITIPNVPVLENIDISRSYTSHFDEDATFHVNNGKIPTKFTYTMKAKLSGLGYVDSIPSSGNYHVGIWRSFGNVPSEQASYYCQERGGYRASDVFAEELRLHPADPKGEASVHSFCSDCHEDTQSTLSEDKVLVSSDVVDIPLGTSAGSYTNRLYVKVPKSYLPNQDSWMIAESTIEPQPITISGVEDVNIDNPNGLEDGEERLFDLQGRPLSAPVPGQPFIRVTRTASTLLLR